MHRRAISTSFVASLTLVALAAKPAAAFPIATARDAAAPKLAPAEEELAAAGTDFAGIVALNNCSGALVRFATSKASDKAMVLTNGHCYEGGFLDAGEVITNVTSRRTFSLLNPSGSRSLGTLRASKVLYATMTDTDVTLYQLSTSYSAIKSQYGIDALTISSSHPSAGDPIRVVSGYWRRVYSCSIDDFVYELKEADWTFSDSIRYTSPGCQVIPGTSGSPVLHASSKQIIGINNTGNESGERCTLDNPCEVDKDGNITVRMGASYGEQVYQFYTCLTADNRLDLTQPGCMLPKP